MASTSLTASYLTPDPSFNWFFLLELIVSCILVLFFLLYFNRLFATLLSYAIRAYTWHYYRAYVDINALQISLLGGRIFFKDIRYHGVNETIFIHGGFVTWRYWKRRVERTNLSNVRSEPGSLDPAGERTNDSVFGIALGKASNLEEHGGAEKTLNSPCRMSIKVYGLEWFIYNRTPAYDGILAGFGYTGEGETDSSHDDSSSSASHSEAQPGPERTERTFNVESAPGTKPCLDNLPGSVNNKERLDHSDTDVWESDLSKPGFNMLEILPLKIECSKGAIVMGNENTRSVLTTTFNSATGHIAASNAGPLDLYRQNFSFHFNHPVVQMRPNPDFKQNQLATAKVLSTHRDEDTSLSPKSRYFFGYRPRRRKLWHSIRDLVPYFQKSVESFDISDRKTDNLPRNQAEFPEIHWVGLSRYLDEEDGDEHEKWNSVEYARFSTIIDSPGMDLTYYWDIPGRVRLDHSTSDLSTSGLDNGINRAFPPEWGIDLNIQGGTINYGPWADRERVGLQNVFFPNFYRSSEPAVQLVQGGLRQHTAFKLRIEVGNEVLFRIPTREQSKDWLWKGRADAIGRASKARKQSETRKTRTQEEEKGHVGPDIRPFGWLALRVGPDSTVNYAMDMVASPSGFRNELSLDLRETKLSSSVNHGLLWQCPRQLVTCDLSNPLCWNELRSWRFAIESQNMELFILRDHVFLLTDLVSDWASGTPPDYYTFVPFIYNIDLTFSNLQLFLNVNDRNIISNPSDLEDNKFIVVKGKHLSSIVTIPLNKYQPDQNAVKFEVNLEDGGVEYLTPLWDTLHTFLPGNPMATLDSLAIDGSYNYYQSTSPDLTDTLVLNIDGVSPRLYLYGFLIKSFMAVKENYFGDEMHFRTLEEYQELAYADEPPLNPTGINPNRKSNDMDVLVHINVENPCALLPENIYEQLRCLRLRAALLEVDLRFTNYYMDMQMSISPLKLDLQSSQSDGSTTISGTQLFVDGISAYAHRLFGLPPAEPTYVCNWDFEVGEILGECSTEFLACLGSSLRSFDFSFDNEENTLHPPFPLVLHDVTFLRFKSRSVHVSVLLDEAALILSCREVTAKFNDWANSRFSKRVSMSVPNITLAVVDRYAVTQALRSTSRTISPLGIAQFEIQLNMAFRRQDIAESRQLQQDYIRAHDQRTHRAQWLLFDWEEFGPISSLPHEGDIVPPTMAIPSMPEPIHQEFGSVMAPSYRGLTGSSAAGDSRSARSFLMHSGKSSLRNTKIRTQGARQTSTTPNSESKRPPNPSIREASWSSARNRQAKDGATLGYAGLKLGLYSSAAIRDANPWILPQFSYHKLALDRSELPPLNKHEMGNRHDRNPEPDPESMFLTFDSNRTTYAYVALNLASGCRGFCTPKFLSTLSELLEGLEPKHPIQIIDALQKDVISDIVGYEKAMSQPKTTTAFALRIPSIQMRLVDISDSPNAKHIEFCDEYRLDIHRLRFEIQRRVQRQKDDILDGLKQDITLHAAADRLFFSVEGSQNDVLQERAVFNCDLDDLNLWLSTVNNIRSHLQMRTFDTVTSAKSVERLAFLVRRATTMFDSVASSFQQVSAASERRLQFLVYSVTQSAADIPDPIFLARISYVLRVAPTHLRQHDSWKIISRIRNIYHNMPLHERRELESTCLGENSHLPSDAKLTVLSGFDQWRAWDLAHVEKSYIMRRVWNSSNYPPETAKPSMSLSFTVKTFRFSLDPGPRESDFVVEDLSTVTALVSENSQGEHRFKCRRVIILQTYCASAALRLRWEIVDLIEGVMKVMSTVTLESTPAHVSAEKSNETRPVELQVVFGSDSGSVTLDGVNAKLELVSRCLRGSIVHSSENTNQTRSNRLALLFSAEACSSEFFSQSRTLMLSNIADPYLYFSLNSDEDEQVIQRSWKLAGSCRRLRYAMREDPVSLAHTADRLIEDEVRYIRQLMDNVKFLKADFNQALVPTKPSHDSVHIAMFLDDYQLSFNLLPSLTYVISGDVARMSVMPTDMSQVEVDFDVKKNTHSFTSNDGSKRQTLSTLDIPPANGRILANFLLERKEVDVDMTIEVIHFDASAVRSLLGVLTGPDVSHLLSDLKQNLDVLHFHLSDALSLQKSSTKPDPSANESVVLYKSRLTMAGFEIHANAPSLQSKDSSAEMIFSFGMMQMRLQNGLDRGYAMDYPEFSIDASRVCLELRRREGGAVSKPCGGFSAGLRLLGNSSVGEKGEVVRAYHLASDKFDVELFAETAALVVDIAIYTQQRIKTLDLSHEVQRLRRLRHRNHNETQNPRSDMPEIHVNDETTPETFLNALYTLQFKDIQMAWRVSLPQTEVSGRQPEDLVFSIQKVELSNKKKNAARLRIENMQLQMVPFLADKRKRSLNSALMPELVFNVAYHSNGKGLWLAFQAAGKSLDLRATSEFILPANLIRDSMASATESLREGKIAWASKQSNKPGSEGHDTTSGNKESRGNLFGDRRLRSVLVDVDFAGATVSLQGRQECNPQTLMAARVRNSRLPEAKYGQYVQGDTATTATFRAPGVALKVHFEDTGTDDPTLNAELRVEPSTNTLYPTLVPLVKQMTATVKEIMGEQQQSQPRRSSTAIKLQPQKLMQETTFGAPDPTSIFGRCKVNLGLLFCKQEFSLSCQPIARVAATARFESVYVTVNTVHSTEHGRFLALSLAFNNLEASVKHVYSHESTAGFQIKSMVLSTINSKHLGRTSGMSAILRISPMQVSLNAKQVQDSLLFREIWLPSDDEPSASPISQPEQPEAQTYIVQRYQQVATASAFPWNITIAIEKLEIQLDLGSTLGRAEFAIDNLWVSSNKTSDSEQSMCINFDRIGIESKGRMSGTVDLGHLKVRTSIEWPEDSRAGEQKPLIQASIAFDHLQAKVSFDYQPFLVAHIAMFSFLMYNVRDSLGGQNERLFSILESDEFQVFCTSLAASQALALFQAWQRLVQDKQSAYEASLREIERYLRRKSTTHPARMEISSKGRASEADDSEKAPISLHTGVVVHLRHVNLGVFPSSFSDNQIFKVEAHDAEARFAVSLESGKVHSALGLTLGQLRVALSAISRPSPVRIEGLSVDEIAQRAGGSRGGTILKVPRLVAGMETWQLPGTKQIDYIFHSTFEGKVDVGWNYSRISFIRDMWENHSRTLTSRLGKPLAPSAVRITSGSGSGSAEGGDKVEQQEKITAVVNVPQSKYSYTALEPPVIETPQLRDMGEATPPLEWIGLQRDKLPNVTHQIIIVTLLEIATEVEDAYSKILGS